MPHNNIKERRGLNYEESLTNAKMHKERKLRLASVAK